ncbi:CobW family GTP-binding protein [Natrialbaceae archaeon A-chndr2]
MAVPVTILCGALGAGKTTLLSTVLERASDREIAVVVNDVGSVNVDADLVEAHTDLETGEEVLALENGCICCSLGGELSRSVVRLWKRYDFEYLIVEASGVGEPEPIAHQFVRGPPGGIYDLDAIVTVVNARQFHDTFVDGDDLEPTQHGPDEDGTRPFADLLLEQVEFCDLLVLNKCDLVDGAERDAVVALLETLQPNAPVVTTEYGDLEPDAVLETGLFDFSAARAAAGWKQAIESTAADGHEHTKSGDEHEGHAHGHEQDDHDDHDHDDHDHDHTHPPERYGITVETFHRVRPFHPERFLAFLENPPAGLVRAKGLTWIAGRERAAITASLAGTETSLEVTGRWIASFSERQQETYRAGQPDLAWDEQWGDRESRLALIGHDLDLEAVIERLEECLLTDAEMDDDWSTFENPAPTAMNERRIVSSRDDGETNR